MQDSLNYSTLQQITATGSVKKIKNVVGCSHICTELNHLVKYTKMLYDVICKEVMTFPEQI